MSTATSIFEIVPFELEVVGETPRRGQGWTKPRPAAKPLPRFRDRRVRPRSSLSAYGGSGAAVDTPSGDREPEPAGLEPASAGSSEYMRWLQSTLNRATGGSIPIDGVMSAPVRDAIRDFQRKNRLPASGYIGPDTEAALRRVDQDSGGEMEFEWEFELSGGAMAVDTALSRSRARPIGFVLQQLGKKDPVQGIYRFFDGDGRFYTGMATNLRRRIIDHLWCLTHLGIVTKNHRLVVCRLKNKTPEQVRNVERAINKHYLNNPLSLNKQAELELQELLNL